MKKCFLIFSLVLLFFGVSVAQVRIVSAYNYPTNDLVLKGLSSIRGVGYAADPFKDGHSAIVATNYNDQGHVHVFINTGTDSLQLVWTSPKLASGGGGSTPRYAMFGDLDNDGLTEVIFQSSANGIMIFEWDGVPGSYNFGTFPSQTIGSDYLANATGNCEYMETEDIDGDNENELLVAYNASSNATDAYYSISATGDWSTDNPGFSSFNVEYKGIRTSLGTWGLGGSPVAMIAANLDGTGNKEILLHNWNLKNVTPMRVPAANTYELADTTNHKQNILLGGAEDDVALMGGMAYDIDGDGRDEVYLPTYPSATGAHNGWVHMISYAPNQSVSEIDSTNVTVLDMSSVLNSATFGYGYGDIDGNGKKNIYISGGSYGKNIITAEFQGGDKTDPANWNYSVLYTGDSTILSAITIKDSAGVIDTAKTKNTAFVSKMYARNTDFNKNGKEDMILPYQALEDSIVFKNVVWNATTQNFDTKDSSKIINPKRWGLRILEKDDAVGISAKDLTVITPEDFSLEQNYPNPFNPETTVRFSLPVKSTITLKIYDMLGKEVATLLNKQEHDKGTFEMRWNGTNNFGQKVSSGNYVAELKFGNFSKSIKMTLLK
ncbi:MAG: FG-GAP-like repeat-containing protein [Ignavibacteriaceae bacterium]|jgi:hypothetical protein|nr:FG-GAP-like repeat-containing protein [Ignavibacteriaceae bacterium]